MECRQAVLLPLCLPPTTPIISPHLAAVAQHLMCFFHVLSHVLFGIVVPVILNKSDQTHKYVSGISIVTLGLLALPLTLKHL